MVEFILIGLLSLCCIMIGIRYMMYKCSNENRYIIHEANENDENNELPPKYEDIT